MGAPHKMGEDEKEVVVVADNLVLVDDRAGSRDLAPYIPNSILVRLEFGDVAWSGNGPDGTVQVGAEVKKVGDLVQSITTGRLMGHQMPGLVKEYDYTYLIIEEMWRCGRENAIEVWKQGRWTEARTGRLGWTAVQGIICSLEHMLGVTTKVVGSTSEAGELIRSLARWWGKPWEGHHSHKVIYTGARAKVALREGKVSFTRKVASILPGVGVDRSSAVEAAFPTVEEMVLAEIEEWEQVPGIGKVTAKLVMEALHDAEGEI